MGRTFPATMSHEASSGATQLGLCLPCPSSLSSLPAGYHSGPGPEILSRELARPPPNREGREEGRGKMLLRKGLPFGEEKVEGPSHLASTSTRKKRRSPQLPERAGPHCRRLLPITNMCMHVHPRTQRQGGSGLFLLPTAPFLRLTLTYGRATRAVLTKPQ